MGRYSRPTGNEYIRQSRPPVETEAVKEARKAIAEGAKWLVEYRRVTSIHPRIMSKLTEAERAQIQARIEGMREKRRAVPLGEVVDEIMAELKARPTQEAH